MSIKVTLHDDIATDKLDALSGGQGLVLFANRIEPLAAMRR